MNLHFVSEFHWDNQACIQAKDALPLPFYLHGVFSISHEHKIPMDPWWVGVQQDSKQIKVKHVASTVEQARMLTALKGHVFIQMRNFFKHEKKVVTF